MVRYWHRTNTANFGNCYSFNYAFNELDAGLGRKLSLTGATSGLEVELHLDQMNYMAGAISQKAGARLAVHPPDSFPGIDGFGLDLQPGTASSVAIQLVRDHYTSFWRDH